MDQLDRDLIRLLQRDARMPFTKMAEELGQADTTVHFRTKKLKSNNIVTRFSALLRPEAMGYKTASLFRIEIGGHILPDISKDRTRTFAEEIAPKEHYLWIMIDEEPMVIHALVMGKDEEDIEEKADALRKSPDVVKVTVTPTSKVVKGWEISGYPHERDE